MAGKNAEKLGKFEDFEWRPDEADADHDFEKTRKYVFNLLLDKAKAQDARDEARAEVKDLEGQVADLEKKVADADASGELEKAQAKIAELESQVGELTAAKERSEVIAAQGLDAESVKKLEKYLPKIGKRDELEEKASEIIEDFGLTKVGEGDGDEDDSDDDFGTVPRVRRDLRQSGDDPDGSGRSASVDFDKAAEEILAGGPFR